MRDGKAETAEPTRSLLRIVILLRLTVLAARSRVAGDGIGDRESRV